VATSASGVAAHFRLGNVDIKMGTILLLGGLTGAAIGVEIIKILRALGNADVLIKLTYIVVLGSVGGLMLADSVRNLRRGRMMARPGKPPRTRNFLAKLPLQMSFPRSRVQHSVLVPFFLCAVVGVLAAIMGVGGGFLMVPMMVYLLRMPAHAAVGTDLFQILFTCAGVTYMQATANHTVDLVLALLLAAGSTVGAQIGAVVSKRLRGEQLMIILASLALAVVVRMAFSLVLAPASLLAIGHGHGGGEPAAVARPQKPAEVAPDRRPIWVRPEKINIGANYSGADIRIEGIASPGSQVVVVARGPDTAEVFERKGRAGPIWITTGKVHVAGVPSLFIRYATEPAEGFLPREEIERFQLDPAAIRRQMRMAPPDPEQDRLRDDYMRLKVNQRVYRVIDGGLSMGTPGQSGVPFSVAFHWPRKAPPATYQLQVHECRGGRVVATATVPLEVAKIGFPAAVAGLAATRAPLYGVAAILVAVLAGFGIDFLAARLRKRLTRSAVDAAAVPAVEKEKTVGKQRSH
jgi:uncharacterized membrane protein YfcA